MAFLSGNSPKSALRAIILLILVAGGVSLIYSKEISKIYKDWKTGGSSEESISLPQNNPAAIPINEGAAGGQTGTQTGGLGYGIPDPLSTLLQTGFQNGTGPVGTLPLNSSNYNATAINPGVPFSYNATEPFIAAYNATDSDQENQGTPTNSTDAADAPNPVDPTAPVGGVEITTASGQQVQVGGVAPLQRQDSVVTRSYITDLAEFLVNSYYPPGTHSNAGQNGYIASSLLTLNMHYGADANRYFGRSRVEILRYVLSPSMLEALYRLYANNFLSAMRQTAESQERQFLGGPRQMSPAERKQMFSHYAAYTEALSSLFEACAASPAIMGKLDTYYLAAVNTYASNQAYIAAGIAYDQADSSGKTDAKAALDASRAAYEKNFNQREDARDELLLSLKRYPGVRDLSDSNMLYTAAWIKRRLADGSADADALSTISRVLNDLSSRMKNMAEAD